ncbi:MAG: DUF6273 domain-containing protein [Lachnospiraceae bacterium]|nr:DUF6273 domain-containing protein [Lachnospiraceae bacterium]
MAIFKCKMCGGSLEVQEGMTVCECEYCGTEQTLPSVKEEELQGLFNRANVLRMKSEFDKAADLYEKIIQKNETDAEAYWGLILCKYGIEYVEDPVTYKRVPTCHRASYDAVTADEDYRNAIKHADMTQKLLYEAEAKAIEEIQKGIIALAQKEEPYDVFICYKETDEFGKRTQDSVIANDIYYQLTQEGFKVFYAAITLEDKLGTEYEPYIFSALNSAKVMLAIGTNPEYFNAVWVKNEWSRFLKIMKMDRSKLLIPCYRGMDAYELPEEFAHLQAQDMSKIGFINDLVRGIKKVVVKESEQKVQETVIVQNAGSTTAAAQIQRGNIALEDHEWGKADEFFEEALNLDPECAEAYVGKLLARDKKPGFASWVSMQKEKNSNAKTGQLEACPAENDRIEKMVRDMTVDDYLSEDTIKKLYQCSRKYSSSLSCRKRQKEQQMTELASDRLLNRARQYADGETKSMLEDGIKSIETVLDLRIQKAENEDQSSVDSVKEAYAAHLIDADEKVKVLNEEAQKQRETDYQAAVDLMTNASDVKSYEVARDALKERKGYKDSDYLADKCQSEIDRINEAKRLEEERLAEEKRLEEERLAEERRLERERLEAIRKKEAELKAKKTKRIATAVISIAIVAVTAFIVVTKVIIPNNNYKTAVALMESGDYEAAITAFEAMNGYKDSANQVENCRTAIKDAEYEAAVALMESGDYEAAIREFEVLDGYKDSELLRDQSKSNYQKVGMREAAVGDLVLFGKYEQDIKAENGREDIAWRILAKEDNRVLLISQNVLYGKEYNQSRKDVTWETCTLRSWLNGEFLTAAFNDTEQEMIMSTNVSADANPEYDTNPGNDTQDKIFLLSIIELEKYFKSDGDRECKPTDLALKLWVYTDDSSGNCDWWLRSPGKDNGHAVLVGTDGYAFRDGAKVDGYGIGTIYRGGVRPALWINLDS